MMTALACLLTLGLAPAQEGKLEIVNPRATYGYLGALRPKEGKGILPGDVLHFRFDVKNMKLDSNGRASYSLLVEVFDAKGHQIFRLGPHNATAQCYLGGDTLPCSAHLDIPLTTKPGVHTLKVTVHDRSADKTVGFEYKGLVRPADFGIVQVGTFADREGKVPKAPVGVLGSSVFINFAAVGFVRDKTSKQPDIDVSLRVLDAEGKPTMPKPLTGRADRDIPEGLAIVPMQFGLTLNRAGHYTIELSATDRHSGKSARVTFPIRALAAE
jgi:hypothetical protein